MKTETELQRHKLGLKSPLETSRGAIETRDCFFVRVKNEDGYTGVGEASPLPGWTESVEETEGVLKNASENLERGNGEYALSTLEDYPSARHGVSLALSDMKAKPENLPLYRYLCPPDSEEEKVEEVAVNATVGDAPVEETRRQAVGAIREGFEHVKIKVGKRSVDEDVRRIKEVQENVPENVKIRCDANGAWSYEDAKEALSEISKIENVEYVEQPLPPGEKDIEEHTRLRDETGISIALDESLISRGTGATRTKIEKGSQVTDVLVLKPMVLGGPDRVVDSASVAVRNGADVTVTTTIDSVVARTGAVHAAATIALSHPESLRACGLATGEMLKDDFGPDPAPVSDGRIQVPQGAGNGTEGPWTDDGT